MLKVYLKLRKQLEFRYLHSTLFTIVGWQLGELDIVQVHPNKHGRLHVFILTQSMAKHGIQLILICIKLHKRSQYRTMDDSVYDKIEIQQIRFSTQTLRFAIEDMLKRGEERLYYSNVVQGDRLCGPGVLHKHLTEVVINLQYIYSGRLLISRTPGGIVVHCI
jgi:hypothetical protein